MKKLLLIGLVASLGYVSSFAAVGTVTVVLPTASMTNMLGTLVGSALVTQVIVTAPAANTASINLIDSVTNILTYTNSAYATLGTYATNLITGYTNFFGTATLLTNLVLVTYSNFVPATAYSYPIPSTITVPTNASIVLPNQQLYFYNAIWVTNLGSGNATITLNYSKP